MTYIVSGGALNSTHSLTHELTVFEVSTNAITELAVADLEGASRLPLWATD